MGHTLLWTFWCWNDQNLWGCDIYNRLIIFICIIYIVVSLWWDSLNLIFCHQGNNLNNYLFRFSTGKISIFSTGMFTYFSHITTIFAVSLLQTWLLGTQTKNISQPEIKASPFILGMKNVGQENILLQIFQSLLISS